MHPPLLYVTFGLPYPPHSGARVRDFHLIQRVARTHALKVLALLESRDELHHIDALQAAGIPVETFMPLPRISRRLPELAAHLAARRPLATFDYFHPDLFRGLQALTHASPPGIVQIEHSFLAPYAAAVAPGWRTVLSLHNLGSRQYESMKALRLGAYERLLFAVKAWLMRDWELRLARGFDQVLCCSPVEAAWLRDRGLQAPIAIVENGVDADVLQPMPAEDDSATLIFVGVLGYAPNVDAARFLCREVLPLVQDRAPGVRVLLVGRRPRPQVRALAGQPGVELFADVPDVAPFYRQAAMAVAPLRAGGGTRLKILEAMALGRPVVATTLGCEGLEVRHEEHLLIADSAADFAAAILRLLANPGLRGRLAANARRLVEARYGWDAIAGRLLAVYAGLFPDGRGSDFPP